MDAAEIFISYSRRDRPYANELVNFLRAQGLDVWIDDEIATGERWDRTLRDRIDNCKAFILVMSPDAEESSWVGEEIDRARARNKPILPVLLSGDVFFGFSRTQYDDVTGGRMPGPAFVERLRGLTGVVEPASADETGAAQLSTFDGHEDAVTAIAYSPDGRLLASGSRDETVRVWPATGGAAAQVLHGHADTVWSVVFTATGRLLSGGADGVAFAWQPGTGQADRELRGHTDVIHSVTASPDGLTAATASEDGTGTIWPLDLSGPSWGFGDRTGPLRAVAYSPDGRHLAVGGRGEPHLRDPRSGARTVTLAVAETYSTTGLAWSPDSRQVAVAGEDGQVRIHDAATGTLVRTIRGQSGRIYAVAWSPDGQRLATAGLTGVARIWRAHTGDLVDTLTGHSGRVFDVAWSPRGGELATASGDRTIRRWKA